MLRKNTSLMEPSNAPTFTLPELISWLAVASSIVGLLAVFGRGIKDWLKTKWDKRHAIATVEVELKKVSVTEREAQTHEIAVILEGFTAVTAASQARAESAEKSAESAHERVEKVETRMNKVEEINGEMIKHIQVLEAGYPNPPGPPQRPNWHL